MDTDAKRALELFREKVRTFYRKRYDEGDMSASINVYDDVVAVLEKENGNVLATLIALLEDTQAYDMHVWIVDVMRGMGQRGMLSREGAQAPIKAY